MRYLFIFLPLVVFLFTSFKLNNKKIINGFGYVIAISVYEALLSYMLVAAFFLQGYFPSFLYFSISIISIIVLAILFTFIFKEHTDDWDYQIETLKNNMLVFFKTLLPLYFFFIIFRFWNPVLQILISILFTVILSILGKMFRIIYGDKIKVFFRNLGLSSPLKSLWLWVILFGIALTGFLFDIPGDSITGFFNLQSKSGYLVFDGIPTDVDINYKQKNLISLKVKYNINGNVCDYYYDDDYIYLTTYKSELIIINLNSKKLEYFERIAKTDNYSSEIMNRQGSDNYFVFIDQTLLLFDYNGVFIVTTNGLEKMEDFKFPNAQFYYENNELKLIDRLSLTEYRKYSYSNGSFVANETIIVNNNNFYEYTVINNLLFKFVESNNQYVLDSNSTITYPYFEDFTICFDSNNQIMYYADYQTPDIDYYSPNDTKTVYKKVDVNGQLSTFEIKGNQSQNILPFNDDILLTNYDTLKVINESFELSAIFNHIDITAFWNLNSWLYIDRFGFRATSISTVEFAQVQYKDDIILVQINELVEHDIFIDFPFYSHYGWLTMFPILIGFLFDLTDYAEHKKEISFKTRLNKEKED